MRNLTANDMVRIASAGGGMEISARRVTANDLIRIASAASSNPGTRLAVTDTQALTANDMIRIASAGSGTVQFKE